jgi:hypothetical protein
MTGSTSNLSINEQQAVTAATAKRKEEDATSMAQAAVTTVHQERETLIVTVAVARKTLDEAWAHERATVLAWEKEKTITHHLEQQLAAAQGIAIP